MSEEKNIFGCFVSSTAEAEWSESKRKFALEQGKIFRSYLWGENGIDNVLKKMDNENYGNDLKLALFQFYVNPIPYELEHLKEIESYRKKEKSIGIPIVVNDENFFSKTEEGRYSFLKQSIFQKLELLAEVVKKKKLDTKMELLKADLQKLLTDSPQ